MVISTVSSILLYSLDNTITANILPPVINDLGNVDQLAWISVGFMIGGLCVALPYGKLYGLFNAKWLYIGSNVLFMVGSALCGAAPNLACLIVGRVIAGAGGNGMYVGVLTIISVNTSNKERPTYLSLIGLTYGLGTVLGPIIGGAFAESGASWRWGFYINLVIGGAFMPVYFFLVPSFDPRPGSGFFARLKLFDSIGAVLQAAGLLCGLMAINFGGTLYDWNSGQTIALFVVGGILLIVFSIQQVTMFLTSFEGRMFPVQMLKMKQPVLLFILMAANNSSAQALVRFHARSCSIRSLLNLITDVPHTGVFPIYSGSASSELRRSLASCYHSDHSGYLCQRGADVCNGMVFTMVRDWKCFDSDWWCIDV